MLWLIILCALFSFFVTLWATPWLIKYLRHIGLLVRDQHKPKRPLVTVSGGISVLGGVVGGLMLFMFFITFSSLPSVTQLLDSQALVFLLVALITIFIITFVGFIDDLLIRESKDASAGLKQWQKPLLTLAAAVPLMVAKAGTSTMILPVIGYIDFGLFYPLLLVPIGVLGAANMVNMLAGLNGMEAGMGIVYMLSLGSYAYVHERYTAALIAFVTLAALVAFYLYNKVPAKIIPGDSGTYLLGAAIAVIAIIGNLEKAALIISIPFIIELILKLRGKLQKKTVGYIKNGKVHSNYKKIYAIPHIFMRTGKYTERQIVAIMIFIQVVFSSLIWVL